MPLDAPTVTSDYKVFASYQSIGGPQDAIHGALPCSISVVKEVFCVRIVYGYDGVLEAAVFFHCS